MGKSDCSAIWRSKNKEHIAAYTLAHKEEKAICNRAWAKANPEKVKEKAKKYYDSHPEKTKASRKRYYDSHRSEAIEYSKAYAQANKEEKARYMKEWRAMNKEKIAVYMKDYREVNADKIKEAFRSWRATNPERVRELHRAWNEANPERVSANRKTWKAANPEKFKIYNHEKKARKRNATIEKFLVSEIYNRDGWVCQLCHKKVNKKLRHPNPLSASLDHIIPLSKGGEHSRQNTHLAHLICNVRAHTSGIKQLRMNI